MNKIRTQFLALLAVMLMGTGTASAVDYGIYVGETMVTSSNASNILGNGQFSYNASTKTLTVTNANLTNDGSLGCGISNRDVNGLIIKLVGTSTFNTRNSCIDSKQSFYITGTGTLNGTSSSTKTLDFWSEQAMTCTINGPVINLKSTNGYAVGDYRNVATLAIKGADTRVTLTSASSYATINNLKSLTLSDGLKIVHPQSASFNSSLKTVASNGTACKGTVAIGITYGLYIGETMVNSYNYDDVNGDGMFAYRPTIKTLDVRSGSFTNTGSLGSGIDNREVDGLTIHLTGRLINITARNYALYSEKSFKITGPGTLNATSNSGPGLMFGGSSAKTFTIAEDANGESPTLNLKGSTYGIRDYNKNTTMTVKGAATVLTLLPSTGYAAVDNLKDMTFADGLGIVTPTGPSLAFYSSLNSISLNGSDVYKGKVDIAYDYGIFVGETKVSKLNYSDILGNGQFKYDPSSKKLNVNNATLDNQGAFGNGIDNRLVDNLIVNLIGTNRITARNDAVTSTRSISFTGSGTLNAYGTYGSALSFWSSGNKTCTVNGPTLHLTSNGGAALEDSGGNTTLTMTGTGSKITMEQLSNGYPTVHNLNGLSLGNYHITEPAGAKYSSSLKSITLDGSTPTKEKVIISSTPASFDLWIGKTRVTPENASDIFGNGQLSYNAVTKTLTMTNFNYTNTEPNNGLSSKIEGLNICVVGTNRIAVNDYPIGAQKSLSFTGRGALTLEVVSDAALCGIALWSEGDYGADVINCTIDGPKMTIISPKGSAFSGNVEDNNTIFVKGSTTRLVMEPSRTSGNGCLYLIDDFQMGEGISVMEPKGAYFDSTLKEFTLDGKTQYEGRVVVSADIDYGISVGETIVKSSNANDVLGNGQFSYDYDTNTLTVKDANLDNTVVGPSEMAANQGTGIVNWRSEGLVVKLVGNNVINCRSGIIASYYPMTIAGRGKLSGTATEGSAISLCGENTVLTIDSASLDVTGKTYGLHDWQYHKSKVVMKGTSNLVLWSGTGYETIKDIDALELGSDIYINQPLTGYFDRQLRTFTTNGRDAYQGKISIGYYYINIAGTKVNRENCTDVLGNGTVSYQPDSKILTLKNANITYTDSGNHGIIAVGIDGLNVRVEGTNSVTSAAWVLSTTRSFSITGDGSLTLKSTGSGGISIWSKDGDDITCNIFGPKVTIITPEGCSFAGSYAHINTVIVSGENTRLDMQPDAQRGSNGCLYLMNEFVIGDGLYVTEPAGGYFDPNLGDFTVDGESDYLGRVLISSEKPKAVNYGMYIAETAVTSDNAADILGDGQFSYDPSTKTLVVNNANLENYGSRGSGISNSSVDGLTIYLMGDNVIKARNRVVYSERDFTIAGPGSLKGSSTSSDALFLATNCNTLTIVGPTLDFSAAGNALNDYARNSTVLVMGEDTKVTLHSNSYYTAIDSLENLELGRRLYITEPAGGYFDPDLLNVTTDGETVYRGTIVISKMPPQSDYFTEETDDSVAISYHVTSDNTVEVGAQNGTAVSDDATEVIIPETVGDYTVTAIAPEAFEWNYNLNTVYLPATIETIGYGAFSGCGNLYNVYIRSRQAPTLLGIDGEPTEDNNAFAGLPTVMPGDPTAAARSLGNGTLDDSLDGATLHVPDGCLDEYNKSPWNYWFTNIIPDATKHGDVNGDFTVDVADIATVIDVMATDKVTEAADVNNDGVVDVADIATVIDIMAANARLQKEMIEE